MAFFRQLWDFDDVEQLFLCEWFLQDWRTRNDLDVLFSILIVDGLHQFHAVHAFPCEKSRCYASNPLGQPPSGQPIGKFAPNSINTSACVGTSPTDNFRLAHQPRRTYDVVGGFN
jgi:hypothetical protein